MELYFRALLLPYSFVNVPKVAMLFFMLKAVGVARRAVFRLHGTRLQAVDAMGLLLTDGLTRLLP